MSGFVYVYAFFTSVVWGYKLSPSSQWIYRSNLLTCSTVMHDWIDKTFFIPTHSALEITAFESHTPSDLIIFSDSQPQCWTDLAIKCIQWTFTWLSPSIGYNCGTDGWDRCYDWSCETICWMDDGCFFKDVWMWDWPSGCFVAGTMITMVDWTKKHVESVITWDILLGAWGMPNTVDKLFKIDYRRKLYSLNGGKHFVSDTHPFMTTEWWKSFYPKWTLKESPDLAVSLLEVGDVLVTESWLTTLISVDFHYDRQYVYNFKTHGNHTYYADWFLVHNPMSK